MLMGVLGFDRYVAPVGARLVPPVLKALIDKFEVEEVNGTPDKLVVVVKPVNVVAAVKLPPTVTVTPLALVVRA